MIQEPPHGPDTTPRSHVLDIQPVETRQHVRAAILPVLVQEHPHRRVEFLLDFDLVLMVYQIEFSTELDGRVN